MRRWIAALSIALAMLMPVPAVHAGSIYKCIIHGTTTFQDHPCPGGKPNDKLKGFGDADSDSYSDSDLPIDQQSPTQLFNNLYKAADQERATQKRLGAEQRALRDRWSGQPRSAAAMQATRQFEAKAKRLTEAATRRQKRFSDRLKQLCPGGASRDHQGVVTCHHR